MFQIKLKELRDKKGISQYKMAAELSISQSTIGNWEAGKREPNFKTLIKLADYFGVSVDYLIGHEKKSVMERPTSDLAENFIKEFGDLFTDKNFKKYATLYKLMNSEQRLLILGVVLEYANQAGIKVTGIFE